MPVGAIDELHSCIIVGARRGKGVGFSVTCVLNELSVTVTVTASQRPNKDTDWALSRASVLPNADAILLEGY